MPSPQRIQWAKVRSIVVAVVAIAVLSVLIYLMSGGTWLKAKTYVTTFVPDSTGVEPGADVQLNGVLVGKVESVRLTGSRNPNRIVEVRLKIETEYLQNIPDDSVTEIDSANLLGDKYIDIQMGKSQRPIAPHGEVPYKVPSSTMQNIDMAQFAAQLRIIDQTIIDVQAGKGPLGQFVVSDTLYSQFLDGINQIERKMRAATGTQSQLGQALYSAGKHEELLSTLKQLDDRLAQVQSNRMMRDTTQYDQIRDQLAKVRTSLTDLNAGKGAGGEMLTSDAAYVQWNRMLGSWIENVDALNGGEGAMGRMIANAQTYESLNGALRQFAATVKDFREHPQKFLRLKVF